MTTAGAERLRRLREPAEPRERVETREPLKVPEPRRVRRSRRVRWPGRVRDAVAARAAGDRGVSTIEVVILAPIMILFILVLVAFGQLVDGRGAVDGAARDAARAGSIQRDQTQAEQQALAAAQADLDDTCVAGTLQVHQTSTGFVPGLYFTVEVSCDIRGLGSLGLDIRKTITSKASSPLDPYRRAVAD